MANIWYFICVIKYDNQKMKEEEFVAKVGRKIKEVRTSLKISQQDLAAKCNFEKSNMSRIEAGRANLTLKTLYKICSGMGIKVKDIVDV